MNFSIFLFIIIFLIQTSFSASTHDHTLGLVSNVYNVFLPTTPLPSLINQSIGMGVHWIELRQGSLGAPYENADQIPSPEHIANLVKSFTPAVSFGYAFVLPVFFDPTPAATFKSPIFQAALNTANAVQSAIGSHDFLLRIVDLSSKNQNFNSSLQHNIISTLDALSDIVTTQNGFPFAIENALLSWDVFQQIIRQTALTYAFDPCNIVAFSNPKDPTIPYTAASSLSASQITILHAKQDINGTIAAVVTTGDLDWYHLASILNQNQFSGPILLEIASSFQLFEDIQQSILFLTSTGFSFQDLS